MSGRKSKKTNSQKHTKNVAKSLAEKRKQNAKAVKEKFGRGSPAPAYRTPKLGKTIYHGTFPSTQGVVDNQMSQIARINGAFKAQKAASEFASLWNDASTGKIQISDDYKKQMIEVQKGIEAEQERAKISAELEKKKQQWQDLRAKNNDPDLNDSRDGKVPKRSTLKRLKLDVERDIETETERHKALKDYKTAEKDLKSKRQEVEALQEEVNELGTLDGADLTNADKLRDYVWRVQRQTEQTNEDVKRLKTIVEEKNKLLDAESELRHWENELNVNYSQNPDLCVKL